MATLLGDATLTTATTFTADDNTLATNDISVLHETAFRRPISLLVDGGNDKEGSFLAMLGDSAIEYTEPEYLEANSFIPEEALSFKGAPFQTDRFVFDFSEINSLSNTEFTEISIQVTVKPLSLTLVNGNSTATADFWPGSFNLSSGLDVTDWSTPDGHTMSVGTTSTFTYKLTNFLSHSGNFQPFFVKFKSDKGGEVQILDVKMKAKYKGKTLLKQDFVVNDSITYIQKNSGGATITAGSTNGAFIRLGGSDALSFNWNADAFENPGSNYVITGLQMIEYITMINGSAVPGSTSLIENFLTSGTGNYTLVDRSRYNMTQAGAETATAISQPLSDNFVTRHWVADRSHSLIGNTKAGVRDQRDVIARPNSILSYSISDINQDITTALSMTTPYGSAKSSYSSGNEDINAASEFEFTDGTYGRANPYPNNLQVFLNFLYAPAINAESSISSTSEFNITDLIGVIHGMASGDIGTIQSNSTFAGQGGFKLLAESTSNTASFAMSVNAGFQLGVIESESTTATMTIDDDGIRMFLRGDANLTSTFTLTDQSDLFLGTVITKPSTFSFSFGLLGVKIAMADTDFNVLASAMSVTAAGQVLTNPQDSRTFVLPAEETRTVQVLAQTRTNTVSAQSRTVSAVAQQRTVTAQSQGQSIPITAWSDPTSWSNMTTWATETESRVFTVKGSA